MAFEAAIVRPKFDHVALPNILLGRRAVPELVAWLAKPDLLCSALDAIRTDGEARRSQLEAFAELDALLGPEDAITRTATLAWDMLRGAA